MYDIEIKHLNTEYDDPIVKIMTDKETGVQYIIVSEHTYGGKSIAITPRLDKEGKVIIK